MGASYGLCRARSRNPLNLEETMIDQTRIKNGILIKNSTKAKIWYWYSHEIPHVLEKTEGGEIGVTGSITGGGGDIKGNFTRKFEYKNYSSGPNTLFPFKDVGDEILIPGPITKLFLTAAVEASMHV